MTDTVQAALRAPARHMTVMSSHMTDVASRAYPGEWVGARSRAMTRKGGPGVYTPGPLRQSARRPRGRRTATGPPLTPGG